jgi:Flp pilus assembly protein CpaB
MSSKLFTTRQGTVLLGVIAAVIAAIALLVYLNHYKSTVAKPNVDVLVAKRLILSGTTGAVIRTAGGYYTVTSFPSKQVKTGAILDPATLANQVAVTEISPGQQLTAADFGPASTSVATQLNKNQRAVVVALDSPQQVGGQIAAGDHVDVWVLTTAQAGNGAVQPIAKLLFQDMYVLGLNGSNVTLEATPTQSGQLIFASQNDTIYLALRPTIGTTPKAPVITAGSVTGR